MNTFGFEVKSIPFGLGGWISWNTSDIRRAYKRKLWCMYWEWHQTRPLYEIVENQSYSTMLRSRLTELSRLKSVSLINIAERKGRHEQWGDMNWSTHFHHLGEYKSPGVSLKAWARHHICSSCKYSCNANTRKRRVNREAYVVAEAIVVRVHGEGSVVSNVGVALGEWTCGSFWTMNLKLCKILSILSISSLVAIKSNW